MTHQSWNSSTVTVPDEYKIYPSWSSWLLVLSTSLFSLMSPIKHSASFTDLPKLSSSLLNPVYTTLLTTYQAGYQSIRVKLGAAHKLLPALMNVRV